MPQKVLSVCSGIGGFELAGELANQELGFDAFKPVAFCEIDPFCQEILRLRYPNIPLFEDAKTLSANTLSHRGITEIDGIWTGLPCQPYSQCGVQKGSQDDRDLFPEYCRLVRGIRPRWSIIENVPRLLSFESGGVFRRILWEFYQLRANVWWQTLSCSQVGGVHRRNRLWIIAIFPPHTKT